MTHFYNRLDWINVGLAFTIIAITFVIAYALTCAPLVDASKKSTLGPTFMFSPAGGGGKAFIEAAQMGFTEEPGYIRVKKQWYKVHWRFHDKRVEFTRVYAPPVRKDSCSIEFLKEGIDDEE